jgi:hypothetical protein
MMISAQLRFATAGDELIETPSLAGDAGVLRAREEPDATPRPLGDRAATAGAAAGRDATPGGVLALRCAPLGRCCTVAGEPLGRAERGVVTSKSALLCACERCGTCEPDGRGCDRAGAAGAAGAIGAGICGGPEFMLGDGRWITGAGV